MLVDARGPRLLKGTDEALPDEAPRMSFVLFATVIAVGLTIAVLLL